MEKGSVFGFGAWAVGTVFLAAYVLVSLLRQYARPVARSVGRSAQSVGASAQNMGRSLTENAALHAEVRKKELLARKAVAEARLNRRNPDAAQHEIELRGGYGD